ncbi:MAG: hypothetical protein KDK36_08155, partial [Leptospiraceae bacterium]|nr:hypothetical protein [Leptospiraceae bacterium]
YISGIIFILLLSFFVYCKDSKNAKSKNPYAELISTHPAKDKNLYSIDNSWNERVQNIDETHKDYVKKLNEIDDFKEIPKPTDKIDLMKQRIKEISDNEPEILKKIKNKYIYGIYFCEEMGGTGITGIVYENNKPIAGYIILDAGVLSRKANEWISYKENSAFENGSFQLQIKIEEDENDTETNAMEYIILHELGHIVSFVEGEVPDPRLEDRDFENYKFTKYDWVGEFETNKDNLFPERKDIHFYSDKKTPIASAPGIYKNLKKTPFPTLYSALNANDHFAESFVSYIHLYIYNKPWELTITKENKNIFNMKNGLEEERCKKEKKEIGEIVNNFK